MFKFFFKKAELRGKMLKQFAKFACTYVVIVGIRASATLIFFKKTRILPSIFHTYQGLLSTPICYTCL